MKIIVLLVTYSIFIPLSHLFLNAAFIINVYFTVMFTLSRSEEVVSLKIYSSLNITLLHKQ